MKEQWQEPVNNLICQCKTESHIFPSLIGMISLLVEHDKDLSCLIDPFMQNFDLSYLRGNNVRLKDVLNIASIIFNNCENFPKNYTIELINVALSRENKHLYGFQALTLVTELLGFYKEDGISFIFDKLKKSLNGFGVDVVPMELEDSINPNDASQDQLNTQKFVKQVMESMIIANSIKPIELIFSVVNSRKRFRLDLQDTIEIIGRGITKID